MRRHLRNPWVWIAAVLLLLLWLLWPRPVSSPPVPATPRVTSQTQPHNPMPASTLAAAAHIRNQRSAV